MQIESLEFRAAYKKTELALLLGAPGTGPQAATASNLRCSFHIGAGRFVQVSARGSTIGLVCKKLKTIRSAKNGTEPVGHVAYRTSPQRGSDKSLGA